MRTSRNPLTLSERPLTSGNIRLLKKKCINKILWTTSNQMLRKKVKMLLQAEVYDKCDAQRYQVSHVTHCASGMLHWWRPNSDWIAQEEASPGFSFSSLQQAFLLEGSSPPDWWHIPYISPQKEEKNPLTVRLLRDCKSLFNQRCSASVFKLFTSCLVFLKYLEKLYLLSLWIPTVLRAGP